MTIADGGFDYQNQVNTVYIHQYKRDSRFIPIFPCIVTGVEATTKNHVLNDKSGLVSPTPETQTG